MGKFFIALALVAIILTNCIKDKDSGGNLILNDTLIIKKGEVLFNYDKDISISLDSILNDSRCPLTYECIWAGNAELKFIFRVNKNNIIFKLNTSHFSSFISDTLIKCYRITLLSLSPYPEASEIIPQEDYRAEILIKRE